MKQIMLVVLAASLSAGSINSSFAQDPKCKKECCKKCKEKCSNSCDDKKSCKDAAKA